MPQKPDIDSTRIGIILAQRFGLESIAIKNFSEQFAYAMSDTIFDRYKINYTQLRDRFLFAQTYAIRMTTTITRAIGIADTNDRDGIEAALQAVNERFHREYEDREVPDIQETDLEAYAQRIDIAEYHQEVAMMIKEHTRLELTHRIQERRLAVAQGSEYVDKNHYLENVNFDDGFDVEEIAHIEIDEMSDDPVAIRDPETGTPMANQGIDGNTALSPRTSAVDGVQIPSPQLVGIAQVEPPELDELPILT